MQVVVDNDCIVAQTPRHALLPIRPFGMGCRHYLPYIVASAAVLLATGLIIFGICMQRSFEPDNKLKIEKSSDSSAQNFESLFGDDLEAVLSNDGPELATSAQFLIGTTTSTTTSTTTTTESSASGSSHEPNRMEMERSTTTTEVCFQSFLYFFFSFLFFSGCAFVKL